MGLMAMHSGWCRRRARLVSEKPVGRADYGVGQSGDCAGLVVSMRESFWLSCAAFEMAVEPRSSLPESSEHGLLLLVAQQRPTPAVEADANSCLNKLDLTIQTNPCLLGKVTTPSSLRIHRLTSRQSLPLSFYPRTRSARHIDFYFQLLT